MRGTPNTELMIDALAHLLGSDVSRSNRNRFHDVSHAEFDGFEPVGNDSDDFILLGGVDDAPVYPMDVSFGSLSGDSWCFHRVSSLKPSKARGIAKIVTPTMYRHCIARCETGGSRLPALVHYSVVGGRLVYSDGRSVTSKDELAQASEVVSIAHGFMLRRVYMWSVLLKEGDSPSVRFSTDPIGCREAFRLRDIPNGRRRRAALRSWVRQHWRRDREVGNEDKVWVRRHLRGAECFSWNGLSCKIVPSLEDQELNKIRL